MCKRHSLESAVLRRRRYAVCVINTLNISAFAFSDDSRGTARMRTIVGGEHTASYAGKAHTGLLHKFARFLLLYIFGGAVSIGALLTRSECEESFCSSHRGCVFVYNMYT